VKNAARLRFAQKIRSANGMWHRYWTVAENKKLAAKASVAL
jgi:hypothetical protein